MNITTFCMTVGEGRAVPTPPSFDPSRTLAVAFDDLAFLEAQGQQTGKHLAEALLHPYSVPVMIMTTDESPESELKVLEAGAMVFLHKPVQEEAPNAAVGGALGSVSEFPITTAWMATWLGLERCPASQGAAAPREGKDER